MTKILRYFIIIVLIIILVWLAIKIYCFYSKSNDIAIADKENITDSTQVFNEPEFIIYQINGKEMFRLSKEDNNYNEILDKLNSSLVEEFTSIQAAREKLATMTYISNIEEEIYLRNAVLRLIYNETNEIDVVFEKDSILDIIYVSNGKKECFKAFEEDVQKELKEYLDNTPQYN